MDDVTGGGSAPGGPRPEQPESAGPGPAERRQGLALETCYRHPQQFTGVHCSKCGRPICVDCMRPAAIGYQCPDCLAGERSTGYRYQRGIRPTTGMPVVTRALLGITIAMFLVEVATGATQLLGFGGDTLKLINLGAEAPVYTAGVGRFLSTGLFVPEHFTPQLWRLFTPMFLHLGLIHIAFNMYALAILGPPIETAYGRGRFLALYLVTGIMGNVASFVFGSPGGIGVGASTAVFGLLGVWLAYNYRRRQHAFNQANVRAVLITLLINLVLNLSLSSLIDWRGHVGGFLAGVVLGYAAEGIGTGSLQRTTKVLGFVAVLVIGALLVAYRIHQLQGFFG
jgi:membrane associated rhomboid family serine protease